jgi:ADP-ribose pyrophosphatase
MKSKFLPAKSHSDVKILDKQVVYNGFCHVERYTMQHKTFAGNWTQPYTRECLTKRIAAAALPYDPIANKIVIIEQLRVGALEQKDSPWLLELVAGLVEEKRKESLEELIQRELKEEAGVQALDLIHICDYLVSPGFTSEEVRLFCAKVDASAVPKFAGLPEEHEDIRVQVVDPEAAFAAVRAGRIKNAAAIIGLQWLELNLSQVREKFLSGHE